MAELLHKAAESVVAKLEQSAAQLQVLSVMLHHFSCAASHHNQCAPVQSCPIRTFLTLMIWIFEFKHLQVTAPGCAGKKKLAGFQWFPALCDNCVYNCVVFGIVLAGP